MEELDLEAIVKSFIKDYDEWNTFAFENSKSSTNDLNDPAYLKYKEIIKKYCLPDKKFQGLAYGSESSHSIATEDIISITSKGNKATVKTKQTDSLGYPNFYEYQFIQEEGKWFLEELFYDDGQKYKSL